MGTIAIHIFNGDPFCGSCNRTRTPDANHGRRRTGEPDHSAEQPTIYIAGNVARCITSGCPVGNFFSASNLNHFGKGVLIATFL